MNNVTTEIKERIKIHNIETNIFKTNLFAIFLATPLKRENVTLDALLTAVLRRGTMNMQSQDVISKQLEEMYGASFDCGIEKSGDNHVIKFYLEAINEEFLPEKEELTKKCLDIITDIVFNPLIENGTFKEEYVNSEKQNLKQIIESKIDNKSKYALDRCVEKMFKDEPYGLYKYGYIEDIDKITSKDLYEYYKQLIDNCKIDIFCSGILEENKIKQLLEENEKIKKLKTCKPEFIVNNEKTEGKDKKEEKVLEEKMEITQGKLVIGMKVKTTEENDRFATSVYNAILGGGANSKLFQNVREKASLAYTAGSNYIRQKNAILIRCGIEIDKYEKTLETIKEQLEDIRNNKFTDKDIENAKTIIIESVKGITSEQDTEITYYYGQELSDLSTTIEEYEEKIKNVTREEIIQIAKETNIEIIYFLRN